MIAKMYKLQLHLSPYTVHSSTISKNMENLQKGLSVTLLKILNSSVLLGYVQK